ncbi:acyl-CoA dehydrogenase family protein [Streptomyces sp. Da 82-17]|uniref:acyl-CoA dehydrogenase family protein n=1 Tax=Streptomyces sp. Da 82-17 TaxID=3377116 RepID=UPI0038D439F4
MALAAPDRPAPGPASTEPTPADVIARAEAIAPTLVERQAETEQRTYYAQDTHEEFARAGFYRLLVPRRFGGHEFGIDTFLRVAKTLARGCPSTGWMFCLGASHSLTVATLFDESVQAELFADPDFICPATIVPGGSAERTADGDWILDGTWSYSSGVPYASHFLGHAIVADEGAEEPRPLLFVAPRSEWTRLDDWGRQLGLRGSGSHSVRFERGRVPGPFTLDTHLSNVTPEDDLPGARLHEHPQYGGAPLSFGFLEGASLAVGMAQNALDAYEDLMRTRTTFLPPIVGRHTSPDYQAWYGEAAGRIAAAEAATDGAVQQWLAAGAQGPEGFTREVDLRITAICREVVELCWHALEDILFPTAGSSSVRHGERIERVWRDMSMLRSHSGYGVFLETEAKRALARARFEGRSRFAPL